MVGASDRPHLLGTDAYPHIYGLSVTRHSEIAESTNGFIAHNCMQGSTCSKLRRRLEGRRKIREQQRVTVIRGIFALFGRVWRWRRSSDIRCLRHMQMHRCITGTRTRPADGIHHEDAIAEECTRWSSLGHPLDGRDTVRLAGLVIYRWCN